jgi:hypothetical protein
MQGRDGVKVVRKIDFIFLSTTAQAKFHAPFGTKDDVAKNMLRAMI